MRRGSAAQREYFTVPSNTQQVKSILRKCRYKTVLRLFHSSFALHLNPSSKYPASKHRTHLRRHRNELKRLPSSGAPPQHNCNYRLGLPCQRAPAPRTCESTCSSWGHCNRLVAALSPSLLTALLLTRLITFQIYSQRLCK